MDPQRASMTALAASLMRAVHTRCDRPPLLDDPYGDRLLAETERPFVLERLLLALPEDRRAAIAAIADRAHALDRAVQSHPAYGGIVVRARWAEDATLAGLARGIGQYIAVAAGMDTFACRHPELGERVRMIEIDHPATQALKRQRFALAGIAMPPAVRLIAADLDRRPLREVLGEAAYDRAAPVLFTVLGLTQYRSREANLALFGDLAAHGGAGSEVLFDYLDLDAFDAGRASADLERLRRERAQTDEPWVSGFDPRRLPAALAGLGLELVEDLDSAALAARYCRGRSDGLQVPAHMHVARAALRAAR
ncbi:class I SAM-dependent methyltransferase [bacterium]|nr:class I SAM-dependent methyltransferase [bacterium]